VVAISMRIGTRKSVKALVQTEDIARRLSAAPDLNVEIVKFETAGDMARSNDWQTRGYLSLIDDRLARLSCDAEREVLWVLNGHCNSPIAGYSTIDGERMTLTASVLDEDGGRFIEAARTGPAEQPRELGRAVGLELLGKGAGEIIARTRPES